jgi:hypothetical protein
VFGRKTNRSPVKGLHKSWASVSLAGKSTGEWIGVKSDHRRPHYTGALRLFLVNDSKTTVAVVRCQQNWPETIFIVSSWNSVWKSCQNMQLFYICFFKNTEIWTCQHEEFSGSLKQQTNLCNVTCQIYTVTYYKHIHWCLACYWFWNLKCPVSVPSPGIF